MLPSICSNFFKISDICLLFVQPACMLSCFSCVRLCDPMDYSLSSTSVHEILQARILEWVAMPSSRGSFQPRVQTHISYVSSQHSNCFIICLYTRAWQTLDICFSIAHDLRMIFISSNGTFWRSYKYLRNSLDFATVPTKTNILTTWSFKKRFVDPYSTLWKKLRIKIVRYDHQGSFFFSILHIQKSEQKEISLLIRI